MKWTRIQHDANGNSRHVCHFFSLLTPLEVEMYEPGKSYGVAVKRANKLGGRKYHNNQYGGGIVFQAQEGELPELEKRILEMLKGIL